MTCPDKLDRHLGEKSPLRLPRGGCLWAEEALRACHEGFALVHAGKPLHGLPADRWRQLLADAQWLLDAYAPAAVRSGWSVADLFGLACWRDGDRLVLKDGSGGVAARLQGARSLVVTSDCASWRYMITCEPDQYARGAYPDLRPLWDTAGRDRGTGSRKGGSTSGRAPADQSEAASVERLVEVVQDTSWLHAELEWVSE